MISPSRLKEMVEEEMENKIKDLELTLKAKEQECDRLKERWSIGFGKFCDRGVELQAEKEKVKELKKKKEENTTFYLKKYANKDSECLELQHKVNVLKQTLTEIKEIAEQINITIIGGSDSPKDEWVSLYHNTMKAIIQKISECEGNDET